MKRSIISDEGMKRIAKFVKGQEDTASMKPLATIELDARQDGVEDGERGTLFLDADGRVKNLRTNGEVEDTGSHYCDTVEEAEEYIYGSFRTGWDLQRKLVCGRI